MARAHSALTGNNIHEPKGANTASANTVYVADGLGSGNWQKISTAQVATINNPFDNGLLHVRDEKTAGTNPQSLTASTWNIRVLNTTVANTLTGASLASNQITLPSGNYFVEAYAPGFACDYHKAKLYNLTSAADQIIGTAAFASSVGPYGMSPSLVRGKFTLSSASVFELRHYVTTTSTSTLLAVGTGTEVYSEIWFWKIG